MAERQENPLRRLLDAAEPPVRLVLGGIAVVAGVLLAVRGFPLFATLAAVSGLLLLLDAVRNSAVWTAFRAFRAGQFQAMRQALAAVQWPHLLSNRARAYYSWLRGVIEAGDGRFGAARVHLLLAATGDLRTENDRSLVQCLLAETALQLNDREAAREHLRLARALASRPEITRMVERLTDRLVD